MTTEHDLTIRRETVALHILSHQQVIGEKGRAALAIQVRAFEDELAANAGTV